MKVLGRTFRPVWWGFALALAACLASIALGNWQTRRAAEKRALSQEFKAAMRGPAVALPAQPVVPADYVGKRLAARGTFLSAHTVLLDYKIRDGRIGYEVVTPLRLSGGTLHVLVNRGWIAAAPQREILPEIPTLSGEHRIEGYALDRFPQALDAPGAPPRGRVRQNVRVDDFRAETGLALQPIVIEQLSDSGDGLVRDWPKRGGRVETHEAYALQWYSLAVLSVILFVVLSFRNNALPPR